MKLKKSGFFCESSVYAAYLEFSVKKCYIETEYVCRIRRLTKRRKGNRMNRKKSIVESYGLLIADLICIVISYCIAILLRYGRFRWVMEPEVHILVCICFLLVCTLYTFLFHWNRDFITRGVLVEFWAVCKLHLFMALAVMAILFIMQQGSLFSRLVMGYFLIINVVLSWLIRLLLKKMLRLYFTSKSNQIKLMVVTESADLARTVERLSAHLDLGYDIVALACTDEDRRGEEMNGMKILADGDTVLETARQMALDEVFFYLPHMNRDRFQELIFDMESMGVSCHNCLDIEDFHQKEMQVGSFGGYTVVTYSMNHYDFRRMFVKRLVDIIGAIIGLIITGIMTPFVALAIRIDSPGPIFFGQTRIGKNGRRFRIYKFRSMYADAEERKKELAGQNEVTGLMFKMKDDPRITKVGRFLRKTSIDEFPQFYNILKGDMSLVGTRPPTEDEFAQYSSHYRRRLSMTPGLTGLWQISGRSEIMDFDEVVRLDLEYIDNWSLGLDFKILCKTVGVVLTGRGSK